jgi:hypothetical protein
LNEDILAAYKVYSKLITVSSERIALSHSLAGGPLLEMANQFEPAPSKLVMHAPLSSLREVSIDMKTFPRSLSFLFPDVWNNMENASKTKIPLYLIHSRDDKTLPFIYS